MNITNHKHLLHMFTLTHKQTHTQNTHAHLSVSKHTPSIITLYLYITRLSALSFHRRRPSSQNSDSRCCQCVGFLDIFVATLNVTVSHFFLSHSVSLRLSLPRMSSTAQRLQVLSNWDTWDCASASHQCSPHDMCACRADNEPDRRPQSPTCRWRIHVEHSSFHCQLDRCCDVLRNDRRADAVWDRCAWPAWFAPLRLNCWPAYLRTGMDNRRAAKKRMFH